MTAPAWNRRLTKAALIVVGLVAFVPLSGLVEGALGTQDPRFEKGAGIDALSIVGGADALAVVGRLEEATATDEVALPEAFEREVGLPGACRDVRVDASGTIVGCTLDLPPEAALEAVRREMEKRSWAEVALGQVEGATFVKSGGACTWVLVTCTQVGGATSVVYRCS